MQTDIIQWAVFFGLTALMAILTAWQVAQMGGRSSDSNREYFLALSVNRLIFGRQASLVVFGKPSVMGDGL